MTSSLGRKAIIVGSVTAAASAVSVAAVAAGAVAAIAHYRRGLSLKNKVVLITGGSRGLGLALARGFAEEGAQLALCARDESELATTRRDLQAQGATVLAVPCDVSDRDQVNRLVETTVSHYGRIDVLVNNAGNIQVGPAQTMTIEDFEYAMAVMFWGTVYTTFAALPHPRPLNAARIVNITSVGGKVSIPHLLPYSCAKFAAAAFSEGMRAELRGSSVKVVTIAPGLMRTGSHLNAEFKGIDKGEPAWFSVGASMPGMSMSAARAARQIIRATRTGRAEKILSTPANLLASFHGLFPGATSDLLGLVNAVLPHGESRQNTRGADSAILRTPWMRFLTTLGRQAANDLQPALRAQEK